MIAAAHPLRALCVCDVAYLEAAAPATKCKVLSFAQPLRAKTQQIAKESLTCVSNHENGSKRQ